MLDLTPLLTSVVERAGLWEGLIAVTTRHTTTGLLVNEHDTAIVRATIDLAHNLGLIVVAVGVETDEQLEYLRLLGCDRAQGYYFAAPVPAEQFATRPV